jgi:hypothetical protein
MSLELLIRADPIGHEAARIDSIPWRAASKLRTISSPCGETIRYLDSPRTHSLELAERLE